MILRGCHNLLENMVGITLVNLMGHTIKQNQIRVVVALFIKKTYLVIKGSFANNFVINK